MRSNQQVDNYNINTIFYIIFDYYNYKYYIK